MTKGLEGKFSTTVISWNLLGEDSRSCYRLGYLNAAEILANATTDNIFDSEKSYVIYPTLYLYRHFIEITIKDYVDLANFIGLVDTKKQRESIRHDIVKAYDLLKIVQFEIFGQGIVDETIENCEEIVSFFHELDQCGDGFRYPLDKRGQAKFTQSVPVDLPWIRKSVKLFERFMGEMHDELRNMLDPNADENAMISRIYFW